MEIRTFDPRLGARAAVERTDRITIGTFLRAKLSSLLGREEEPEAVSLVYYPDYVAYTTVELRRYLRDDRTVRFLVGIDAVTGRVGEVDVELPPRETVEVDPDRTIPVELAPAEAESEWRDWILPYVDRRFRPVKRPEFLLDELELVHVPYWLIDYGTLADSYVVSGLTEQIEEVVSLKPVEGYYERIAGRPGTERPGAWRS